MRENIRLKLRTPLWPIRTTLNPFFFLRARLDLPFVAPGHISDRILIRNRQKEEKFLLLSAHYHCQHIRSIRIGNPKIRYRKKCNEKLFKKILIAYKIEDLSTNSVICARILIECFFRDTRCFTRTQFGFQFI